MGEFLSFKSMITPVIIKFVFWVGSGLCVLKGLHGIVGGTVSQDRLLGLVVLLLGPLAVRLACEALLVFFRMNDTLKQISDKLGKDDPAS